MCNTNEHIVLTESEDSQISWCKGCKNYSLIFRSFCMAFSDRELLDFKRMLCSLNPEDYHYDVLGSFHAIIKYDYSSIGISLSKSDTKRLVGLIEEAMAMKEVFGIIYN